MTDMDLSNFQVVRDNLISCIIPLRKIISEASGIALDDIINGESIRGADLRKKCGTEMIPYSPEDDFIVFQLQTANEPNVTFADSKSIMNCTSLVMQMSIYGNHSLDVANNLKTKIQGEYFKDKLCEEGFVFLRFETTNPIREFVNDTLYIRVDTSFSVGVAIRNPAPF